MALVASSCSLFGGGTYTVRAEFTNGQGLFQGIPVTELGVRIGTLTSVADRGKRVLATMQIQDKYPLPASADANVIGESVLGQRYIQFTPAYTGGPKLAGGTVLPTSRTSVPVTVDQLLSAFERYMGEVKPKNVSSAVTNLARLLSGQGAQLNRLLRNAAGTVSLLAAKGNDLGRLMASLAQLTGTLDQHDQAITQLIDNYNAVTGVLSANGTQLAGTIDNLNQASLQLASLLQPNLPGLKKDLAVITTAGRTLDRNLGYLDGGLHYAGKLFTGSARVFVPSRDWLTINLDLDSGTQAAVIEARTRDLLAGVCRRLLAHHSAGLSQSTKKTLARCGNPDSGFFNPVLGLVPKLFRGKPITPQTMLSEGLGMIPGLSEPTRGKILHQVARAAAPGPSRQATRPPTSSTTTSSSSTTTTTRPKAKHRSASTTTTEPLLPPLPPLFNAPGSGTGGGL